MLTELFKTEERTKILRYVMLRSSYSVSEVSRSAGVNKGLVSRYLRLLEGLGLLRRDGRKYALLNGAFPRAVRLILNLEKLDLSTLGMGPIEGLKGLGIYGSWARGTNHLDSDLDLWIRADSLPKESDLARLQRDLSLRTGAEVNLLVLTPQKLRELKINDPPFYASLITNYLTIKGEPIEEGEPI
ncbi:Bacterial regulatory protein, arsR family [uncultured archaeon]|nr:Bacterial regulatory protein, arsR family [uncultured archaeon]